MPDKNLNDKAITLLLLLLLLSLLFLFLLDLSHVLIDLFRIQHLIQDKKCKHQAII